VLHLPEERSLENKSPLLDKHVDMLANFDTTTLLLRRSEIVREIRMFLDRGGYTEVQTPILSVRAGGAAAKPFRTYATEFSGRKLSLRVAPELWLKRLILGGMDRIFEIGSCFRNEGKNSIG
jgi:lysyl-tRNA synthetase, class II